MIDILNVAVHFLGERSIEFAILAGLITVLMFIHVTWLQLNETSMFWGDYLHKYRLRILICLVIVDATLLPVMWYTIARYTGNDTEPLRQLATWAGRIGPLSLAIAFESLYMYNRKKD